MNNIKFSTFTTLEDINRFTVTGHHFFKRSLYKRFCIVYNLYKMSYIQVQVIQIYKNKSRLNIQ